MKPVAFQKHNPNETRGFSPASQNGNPDESLAFAFAVPKEQEPRSRATAEGGSSDLWKSGKPTKVKGRLPAKPIGFAQLCALMKSLYHDEPDSSSWMEACKIRLVKWGFEYPDNTTFDKARSAVEKTSGPRRYRQAEVTPPQPTAPPAPFGRPITRTEAARLYTTLWHAPLYCDLATRRVHFVRNPQLRSNAS